MLTGIIMPQGGQTTSESKFVKWRKKIGDEIKRGDILFEIETDKANMEVESFAQGVLLAVYCGEGDVVPSGEIVAYIGSVGDVPPAATEKVVKAVSAEIVDSETDPAILKTESGTLASPKAKFLARGMNIKLSDLTGIVKGPVIKASDILDLSKGSKDQKTDAGTIALTPMRRTIARRMTESAMTIPAYNVSYDIDMTRCAEVRNLLNKTAEAQGFKVSYNDLIMKCTARAIMKYPLINASFGDEALIVHDDVNFGLAVSVEGGLLVPVLKSANRKSIMEISRENAANAEKARNGKLLLTDMQDGTITLSSLGSLGADSFNAIINPPESCILAIGRVAEKPVAIGGKIEVRLMMNLTASFDHRVIDGAYGAAFLGELKILLENPALMLI